MENFTNITIVGQFAGLLTTSAYQVQDFSGKSLTVSGIIYILIGLLGVLGNTLVVVVILKSKSMRKAHNNIFITNQSLIGK